MGMRNPFRIALDSKTGWLYFVADNHAYIMDGIKQDPTYPAFEANRGRASIMSGVYRFNAALTSPKRLPPHFEGSLFIMDWSRHWINEVRFSPKWRRNFGATLP